jgi:hypothetical protein
MDEPAEDETQEQRYAQLEVLYRQKAVLADGEPPEPINAQIQALMIRIADEDLRAAETEVDEAHGAAVKIQAVYRGNFSRAKNALRPPSPSLSPSSHSPSVPVSEPRIGRIVPGPHRLHS